MMNNRRKMKNILSKVQDVYNTERHIFSYSIVFDVIKILLDNINYDTSSLSLEPFGTLQYDELMNRLMQQDFSFMYFTTYFDGTDYREAVTGEIMQGCEKGKSIFELGCIFEIGRIIHREAQKGHTIEFPYTL